MHFPIHARSATRAALLALAFTGACEEGGFEAEGDTRSVDERRELVEFLHDNALYTERDESYNERGEPDDYVEIEYRGTPRLAAVHGDQLFIEGDIAVRDSDLYGPSDDVGLEDLAYDYTDKGTSRRGSTGGHTYQWPDGKIYYRFGDLTAGNCGTAASPSPCNPETQATYENAIVDAMKDLEASVPDIQFIEVSSSRSAGNLLIESDGDGNACWSDVGYTGVRDQQVHLSDWCYFWRDAAGNILSPRFSVHHELGHALGLFHEHTRGDRDTNISINWPALKGCPVGATKASDCNASVQTNYDIPSDGRDLHDYDYDSMMHYGSGAITALKNDPATGAPYTFGQRSYLSDGDMAALNVLYPRAQLHNVVFQGTGSQQLCRLQGRENDGNVVYSSTTSTKLDSLGKLDTNNVSKNTTVSVNCQAKTLFWSRGYDYPRGRSSTEINLINNGSTLMEQYDDSDTVHVLDKGLIPILFK